VSYFGVPKGIRTPVAGVKGQQTPTESPRFDRIAQSFQYQKIPVSLVGNRCFQKMETKWKQDFGSTIVREILADFN